MASYRRFTGGGGSIFKFKTVGDQIEGTFVEMRPTAFKLPNMILEVDGAETICSISTGIVQCLEEAFGSTNDIPKGVGLRFRFVGLGTPKPGQQPFKRFEMDVDETSLPEGFEFAGAPHTTDDEEC